jgi:hypothetical protein
MSDSDEPWVKRHLELMEHILDLQRDMTDLKEQVAALKAQSHPSMVSLLMAIMDTAKTVLVTPQGQALLALTVAGLAALGKLLVRGH